MKIAYLSLELPALSATFVYNEILQLETLGDEILPMSVRRPNHIAEDNALNSLKKRLLIVYEGKKQQVLLEHLALLINQPALYLKTLGLLMRDIVSIGLFTRNALGLLYRFFYAALIANALVKNKCEHIHAHFAHVPGDLAMYAATMAGTSFSITAHANDLFERGWLLREKVDRSAFFATISNFNKRYLVDLGANANKIVVVRCGVDFHLFVRKTTPSTKQPPNIGVVCRLIEKKGVDTLIRAAARLKQRGVDFVLQIAGSGPLETELRGLAAELGLQSSQVNFLGAMPHARVSEFIRALDVFVLPCRLDRNGDMDGIPVAMMEAMAVGVPVVSTYLSGIPELVNDTETGLLVQPDDPDELANAIARVIDEDELKHRLVEGAIRKVEAEFSLIPNTQKLRDYFSRQINVC